MKISMMTAAFAAAFCVAGCKYSSVNEGAGDGPADDTALGSDVSALTDLNSGNDDQSGSLAGLNQSNFEDYLTRCTDVEFAPVYFGYDSTIIPSGELAKIDAVAQHLKANADRVTVIEGNCDERGSNEYNMSLGQNRADIVRTYLIQNGVESDRIQCRSYGEEKPAAEGHGESAWRLNRRGEFAIFQK